MAALSVHTTVTSGLQTTAQIARLSPLYVIITVPLAKAQAVAERQASRYPSITGSATLHSALRQAGYPAVQLVVLPPHAGSVTMVLLSGEVPPGSREEWLDSRAVPLTWRNYTLRQRPQNSVTWHLSDAVVLHHRRRLTRVITGQRLPSRVLARLPDPAARQQVESLARHLLVYPGFSGIREDYAVLRRHADRQWRSTRPRAIPPVWPYKLYLPTTKKQTVPLCHLIPQGDSP